MTDKELEYEQWKDLDFQTGVRPEQLARLQKRREEIGGRLRRRCSLCLAERRGCTSRYCENHRDSRYL